MPVGSARPAPAGGSLWMLHGASEITAQNPPPSSNSICTNCLPHGSGLALIMSEELLCPLPPLPPPVALPRAAAITGTAAVAASA